MKQKIVLVGSGLAGIRFIEELLKIEPEAFDMTIIGEEATLSYNRISLSSVLQGEKALDDIIIHDRHWYVNHGIQMLTGHPVIKINQQDQEVITDDRQKIPYDFLILATGSKPYILPIPGNEKEGVMSFRTMDDCQQIISNIHNFKQAAIIGGGLLGLEAARGLLQSGIKVDLIHHRSHVMNRQLDPLASTLLKNELAAKGMHFQLNKQVTEICGDERVEEIRFSDGTKVETDLVIMSTGIQPNIDLAECSGLKVNKGVVVNDYMQTTDDRIFAIGECAEHRGMCYGLVSPLYEQAKQLAKTISGLRGESYQGSLVSTQLKISDVDVFSVGRIKEDEHTKTLKWLDEYRNIYKKMVIENDHIVGGILYGDTKLARTLTHYVDHHNKITELPKNPLFTETIEKPQTLYADMSNSETVCQCNGVTKGAICDAVISHGAATVHDIANITQASSSCGGCRSLVSELLTYCETVEGVDDQETAICECTPLSHRDIVAAIKDMNLKSIKAIMSRLGWQNSGGGGCSVCYPALRYYLGVIYPEMSMQPSERYDHRMLTVYPCSHQDISDFRLARARNIGKQLEETLASIHLPNKVNVTISACQNDCAETKVVDIGLMGLEDGWEIYVGGYRDQSYSEHAYLLCMVENDDDIMGWTVSLFQLYRESGYYRESINAWIKRMGIEQVRERMFDDVYHKA